MVGEYRFGDGFISAKELAHQLDISPRTVRRRYAQPRATWEKQQSLKQSVTDTSLLQYWMYGVPWDLIAAELSISPRSAMNRVRKILRTKDDEVSHEQKQHQQKLRSFVMEYRRYTGLTASSASAGERKWASIFGIDNWWFPFPNDSLEGQEALRLIAFPTDDGNPDEVLFSFALAPEHRAMSSKELFPAFHLGREHKDG